MSESTSRRPTPAAWLLIAPIRFYQKFITPYTPATCRYYPTCSAYAVGALRTHGAIKGTLLTIARLARCNPFTSGGIDKVPPRGSWRRPAVAEYVPVGPDVAAAENVINHNDCDDKQADADKPQIPLNQSTTRRLAA